jgi:hypothetical protein
MATEVIHRSPFPDLDLPETSCWHFIFDGPTRPVDEEVLYIDALTDRQLKYVIFQ